MKRRERHFLMEMVNGAVRPASAEGVWATTPQATTLSLMRTQWPRDEEDGNTFLADVTFLEPKGEEIPA